MGKSSHPLSGADFATFLRVLDGAGGVPVRELPRLFGIAGSILGRLPFTGLERIYTSARLVGAPELEAPVFILGHWRSGTTHLYNVMTQGEWGYVPPLAAGLPWDMLLMARLFRPLLEKALPEHRFIDNIPVTPISPQEDEVPIANMTHVSFYHALYFPSRFRERFDTGIFLDGLGEKDIKSWERAFLLFLKKLSLQQRGLDKKPLRMLIKNPVYTARPAHLRRLFPDAKFIHIHRNPHEVFRSMQNFYDKLFAEFALQPYDHVDVNRVILETYTRMMGNLIEETKDLPEGSFYEARYDDLDARPMDVLEGIYGALDLPGFDAARPKFEAYLKTVKSYKKNKFDYPEETARLVEAHWGTYLDHWGYGRPGQAAA